MKEFPGLTPDLIEDMYTDTVEILLNRVVEYEKVIPRADQSLLRVVKLLEHFMGVKDEKPIDATTAPEKLSITTAKITKSEMQAFIDAGMPSPMTKWLEEYRSTKHG